MASNALLLAAGVVAAGGVGLLVAGPRLAPRKPVVEAAALAQELDGWLREAATAVHARADTLASLPSLQASVSTNAETVRDQTQTELAFRPNAGETITIGQVAKDGSTTVLLVLPPGGTPARAFDRDGARAELAGGRLQLLDVLPVIPQDAERRNEVRGALAIARAIDLAPFAQRLDAAGAAARLEVDGQRLAVGARAIGEGEPVVAAPLASEPGRGVRLSLAIPFAPGGPPLQPIGGGLVGLGLLLGLLGVRRREARVTALSPTPGRTASLDNLAAHSLEEIDVGTIIDGTYEVTGLLGKGGMGAVWQARHLRLPDKRVAVKLLLAGQGSEELLARFRREAEVTSKLGHPNIVSVLDFNTLPSGTPFIVLEYLEGESLAARIARGPMTADAALSITRQIGSALDAAHRAGIVHRDLKPDNVFLVPLGGGHEQVKVLDFGISKMRGNVSMQTQEATLLGTPAYMSPEQANGRNSEVDARSDIWALGSIVHEMLSGQQAFRGENLTVLLVNVLVTPSPTLRGQPGVPDHVAQALDRALTKEPDGRFPDVPSFIAALTGAPLTSQRPVAGE